MDIKYIVHSADEQTILRTAIIDGVETEVQVRGFYAELVALDGSMSQTLRLGPKNLEEALSIFQEGAEITVSFTQSAAPPVVDPAPVEA